MCFVGRIKREENEIRAYVVHHVEQAVEQYPDSTSRLEIDSAAVDSFGLDRCSPAAALGVVEQQHPL